MRPKNALNEREVIKTVAKDEMKHACGYNAMQYQVMTNPHSELGRPKGDNNRGPKGNQVESAYFDLYR